MPTAWGYARGSTSAQVMTLDDQQRKCRDYHALRLADRAAWGGSFVDAATTGKTPFGDRPSGRDLNRRLARGDHVVFTKLDRAFRNARDAINQLSSWVERGVEVHVVDLGMDTSTPIGRLVVHVMVAFGEFERALISERTAESVRHRKLLGLPAGKPPWGYKWAGPKGNRFLVACKPSRAVMALVAKLADEDRLTWHSIAVQLLYSGVKNPRSRTGVVSQASAEKAYRAHHELLAREAAGLPTCPAGQTNATPHYAVWRRPAGSEAAWVRCHRTPGLTFAKKKARRMRAEGWEAVWLPEGKDPNAAAFHPSRKVGPDCTTTRGE